MHAEAYAWVKQHTPADATTVLDIGGRNINGTVRDLFPNATTYRVLDAVDGDNVDIVADASTWTPDQAYDVVVCCEVFEHTPVWPAICATAHQALKPGGTLILTMAGPGRAPHSAHDGGSVLYDGEHYDNIYPNKLEAVLKILVGFECVTVDQQHQPMADVRAVAYRAEADTYDISTGTGPNQRVIRTDVHGGGTVPAANLPEDAITAYLSDGGRLA